MPHFVILGGPNGAGKSTAAAAVLRDYLALMEFVNADTLAMGLSGFAPGDAAFLAGRHVLERLEELAGERRDFAFESTLAGRGLARFVERTKATGYTFELIYLALPHVEASIARVTERARAGGHDIPEETLRRRFPRSLLHFHDVFRPLADVWRLYDNSQRLPRLVAKGCGEERTEILDEPAWRRLLRTIDRE